MLKFSLSLAVAVVTALGATAPQAFAYPDKPITMIVPVPPGGATDLTARLMGERMSTILGQPIVIENRPGATGAIGATLVKQAAPNGYTFMVAAIGTYSVNPFLQKNLQYDPTKDFDLITVAVRTPNVLIVHPSFPANNVDELIAYMKKNPKKVSFASSGSGTSDHLTAALFMQKTKTEGVHVPYKGGAPAVADLTGGHVNASFQNLGAVIGHIKAGRLKALAVSSDKRVSQLPDTPTLIESGYPDFTVYSWQAAAAPKGLPKDVRAKLSKAAIDALNHEPVRARFNELGFEVVANNADEFAKFLNSELARWKEVIETGKITAN